MNAIDDINEALSALAPAQPLSMAAATVSFETCPSADTAPACASTSSRASTNRASAGGTTYKSAAGEAFSTYTGGGLVLTDNFTLRPPESAPTESGGDDAFSNGAEGTLSARLTIAGVEAEHGSITLSSASPPVSSGDITLNAKNTGYNLFPLWVRGDATLDADADAALTEYTKLFFRHNVTSNRDSGNFEVFVDTVATNPSIPSGCLVGEGAASTKFISGTKVYASTSTFCVAADVDALFTNAYQTTAFIYAATSGSWFTSGQADVDPPEAGWNSTVSTVPARTDTSVLSGGTIAAGTCSGAVDETFTATASIALSNARVTCTAAKPLRTSATATSSSENRMVQTWTTTESLVGSEPMLDENRRQLASFDSDATAQALTGNWTSSSALGAADAQEWFNDASNRGALIYPVTNFTSGYLPSTGQPNYSAHSGDHFFYRAFSHAGAGKSNGVIRLYGITTADLVAESSSTENTIKVSFRLPDNGGSTGTAWADAIASFNTGDPTPLQTDGEGASDETARSSGAASSTGCHSTCGGSFVDLPVTFGGFSTVDSGSRINVRITFEDTSAPRPTQKITCVELHDKNGTGATTGACWQ
jgi:hypothetical protein